MRYQARFSGRRGLVTAVAAAVLGSALLSGAHAVAAAGIRGPAAGGAWGKAEQVPGTAALNTGGQAVIGSVSCASAGNCSAGGSYLQRSGSAEAFVVSQHDGTWGKAAEVPGFGALNKGGDAQIFSVSCASAGNCSAGGFYWNISGLGEAFVVSQHDGTWGSAEEVPGTTALNTGGYAQISSVSCASAGNCSAGGFSTASHGARAFVVSQHDGTWGTAEEVPGTAALNTGGNAQVSSVSCGSAGNCSAGGFYTASHGDTRAFAVSQHNGIWGKAQEIPGIAALDQGGFAQIRSVSCASAGNCSAGGSYGKRSGRSQAFVVSQHHGTWGNAEEVPGTATLNTGGLAAIFSVSCASAGNCSAAGAYRKRSGPGEAFVVSQRHGTWGNAQEVPGTAALSGGREVQIFSVSCASAGNCSAGGSYTGREGGAQALVVSQRNGTWGKAQEVPGTAALNTGGSAEISSVSCAPAGSCSAGGDYFSHHHLQAFVVSQAR
jgi:D-alanine-D-alanine ligase-like ATP-grasp enzyme